MTRNPSLASIRNRILGAAAAFTIAIAALPAGAAVSPAGQVAPGLATASTQVSSILADTEARCNLRLTDPAVIGAAKSADCNHLKLLQMMAPREEHDADHP